MNLFLLLSLLVGCGTPEGPQASDYDASCQTVDDCAPVVQRPGCCGCSQWVALEASAAAEFEQDQEQFWNRHQCKEVCLIGCFELAEESALTLTCDAGTCGVSSPDTGLN